MAPFVGISGCNSVRSGGLTSISQCNPQQFHGWNWTETLVWTRHHTHRTHRILTLLRVPWSYNIWFTIQELQVVYVWAPTQAMEIRNPSKLILGCSTHHGQARLADRFPHTLARDSGPTCTAFGDSENHSTDSPKHELLPDLHNVWITQVPSETQSITRTREHVSHLREL